MYVELSKHVGFKISVLGRVVAQGVLVAATLLAYLFCPNFGKQARSAQQTYLT